MKLPRGITKSAKGWRIYVSRGVGRLPYTKRFKPSTPYEDVFAALEKARLRERAGLTQIAADDFAHDVTRYLRDYFAGRSAEAIEERTRHLELWKIELAKAPRPNGTTLGSDFQRSDVTRDDISGVLQRWRAAGLSADTCNKRRTALLALYHALDGKGGSNPVREIAKFSPPKPLPRGVDYGAIAKTLLQLPKWRTAPRAKTRELAKTRPRLAVMAYTGMRPCELMQHTADDWNRREHTLLIHGTGKGRGTRPRTIPLSPQATSWLEEFDRADAYGRFSYAPMGRLWRQAWYAEQTGQQRTPAITVPATFVAPHPYDLRHSYGTQIYKLTGDIKAAQKLLGHSSLAMTDRYTLAGVEPRQVAAVAAFGRSLPAPRRKQPLRLATVQNRAKRRAG